jgi:hypothetical protein
MKKINIYLLDDKHIKHELLQDLIGRANIESPEIEFSNGFEGYAEKALLEPKMLKDAFEDRSGLFLLDIQYSKLGAENIEEVIEFFEDEMTDPAKKIEENLKENIKDERWKKDFKYALKIIASLSANDACVLIISSEASKGFVSAIARNTKWPICDVYPNYESDIDEDMFHEFFRDVLKALSPLLVESYLDKLWEETKDWFMEDVSKRALNDNKIPHNSPKDDEIDDYKKVVRKQWKWFPEGWFESSQSIRNLHKTLRSLVGYRSCFFSGEVGYGLTVGAVYILAAHAHYLRFNEISNFLVNVYSWKHLDKSKSLVITPSKKELARLTAKSLFKLFELLIEDDEEESSAVSEVNFLEDGAELNIGISWLKKNIVDDFSNNLVNFYQWQDENIHEFLRKKESSIGRKTLAIHNFFQRSFEIRQKESKGKIGNENVSIHGNQSNGFLLIKGE